MGYKPCLANNQCVINSVHLLTENINNNIYEVNRTQTANKYIERIKYGRYQSSRPPLQDRDVKEVNWHFEVVFDYGE